MKKVLCTLLFLASLQLVNAQAPAKPEPVGNEKIDGFVNATYDQLAVKQQLAGIVLALTGKVAEAEKKSPVDTVEANKLVKQLTTVEASYKKLSDDIADLGPKGDAALSEAAGVTPVTKVPKATKNVKTGIATIAELRKGLLEETKQCTDLKLRAEKLKLKAGSK